MFIRGLVPSVHVVLIQFVTSNEDKMNMFCLKEESILVGKEGRQAMAMTSQIFVAGIYDDIMQVDRVISFLHDAGFQDSQIAIDSREKGTQHIQETLVDMGMPTFIAQTYEQALEAGKLTMLVRADDRQDEVINILRANAADSLWYPGAQEVREQVVPVREERLQAVRRQMISGEVRIRRRIILEEKTITVQVAREEITVENIAYPDEEQLSELPSDGNSKIIHLNPGDTIRIPVREEQVFVEKRPIIKEEVVLTKQVVQDMQHFTDTVRKEVPRLEQDGDIHVISHDENLMAEKRN
jgi:uncharacterized protein (TIGR02271 family)